MMCRTYITVGKSRSKEYYKGAVRQQTVKRAAEQSEGLALPYLKFSKHGDLMQKFCQQAERK